MSNLVERLRGLHPIEPSNIIAVCEDAADEIERLTEAHKAEWADRLRLQERIEELEAEKQDLRKKCAYQIDNVHSYMKKLQADNERLRAALWTEYQESFNDLGPTRQARWKSAEEYANALLADFDREQQAGLQEQDNE